MRIITALLLLSAIPTLYAVSPKTPRKMRFANLHLTIREDARKQIQADVDALTKNSSYFAMKVERAKTYFPIIEKIFAEEKLPDDFKFLVLQESELVSDAVSSSNAVGYWQFKDFTAREVGMRVDKQIDERMNLISATRGAARYLKQNNFYFDNWLYALQAYQMGAGGTMRSVGKTHRGVRHMHITGDTYWYIKKYLAHKIAFENAINGSAKRELALYSTHSKTSLKKIAETLSVDLDELKQYNKWTKTGNIPNDKQYAVLLPTKGTTRTVPVSDVSVAAARPQQVDVLLYGNSVFDAGKPVQVNHISVVWPRQDEPLNFLATRAGVKLSFFLSCNDISPNHKTMVGLPYFMEKKKNRALEPFHKVAEGETLWEISQFYGVRLKRLQQYNDLPDDAEIMPNSIVWLSDVRPGQDDISPGSNIVELDSEEFFDWEGLQLGTSKG